MTIPPENIARAALDGTLTAPTTVPVPAEICAEAGFRHPVRLTGAVWASCVTWTDADDDITGRPQDEAGRLWDVMWMTAQAIRANRDGNTVTVGLHVVPRGIPWEQVADEDGDPPQVDLVTRIGPDDDGAPVITVMSKAEAAHTTS